MRSAGLRLDRHWAIGLSIWVASVLVSIEFLDRPIATLVHEHLRQKPFEWLTFPSAAVEPGALAVLLLSGLAALAGWRPGPFGRLVLAMAVAALVVAAVKMDLKYAFGRLWPETWVDGNPSWIRDGAYGFAPFHGGTGWASFPSGHTSVIAAPMAVLWPRAGRLRFLCILLPALVAIGLIGMNYHFLGDCLAGAGLGTAIGVGVDWLTGLAAPAWALPPSPGETATTSPAMPSQP